MTTLAPLAAGAVTLGLCLAFPGFTGGAVASLLAGLATTGAAWALGRSPGRALLGGICAGLAALGLEGLLFEGLAQGHPLLLEPLPRAGALGLLVAGLVALVRADHGPNAVS